MFRWGTAMLILGLSLSAWSAATRIGKDTDLPDGPRMRATTETAPEPMSPGWIFDSGDKALNMIPSSKFKCVKDVLGKTLFAKSSNAGREEVWKSNAGVVAYNQLRLSRSPCLAMLTDRYYRDMEKLKSKGQGQDQVNRGRPALNAKVGQGSYAGQQPGFALKNAMEIAQGNRALAMALVGYCGHDDIENSVATVVDFAKSPNSKAAFMGYLQSVSANRAEKMRKDPNSDLNRLMGAVKDNGRASLKINCPHESSPFYAPGALGAEVDLSDETKKKIAAIQAPSKGAGALPAKAYHTSFAAVMGCRLGACGLSPESAGSLLETIATRYRSRRQIETSRKYDVVRQLIEDRFDVNWMDTEGLKKKEAAIKHWFESEYPNEKSSPIRAARAIEAAGAGELVAQNRSRVSWETWKRNIDAAIVARSGPAGSGQLWNVPPMSHGRDPFYSGAGASRPQTSYCPGWPEERCNAARERRDTWQTDVDWTREQQSVGGEFGGKFCAGEPPDDEGVEAQACQALQRLDEGTAKPAPSTAPGPTDGVE